MVVGLNECLGIEIKVLGDDSYSCRCVQVSLERNKLDLGKEFTIEGGIKAVLGGLPKTMPIALALTGTGILLKKISTENNKGQQLFKQAFPSLDPDEFYDQVLVQGDVAQLTISRKSWIDELLERFDRAGLKVLQFSIGPFVAVQIFGQLNRYGNEIQFDGHRFALNEQKELMAYQFGAGNEEVHGLKIETQAISPTGVLAYAAAFQLLLHKKIDPVTANVTYIHASFDAYLNNQQLKRNGLLVLFSSFGLLLLSFMLFSYYNQQNEVLLQQVGAKANSLSDMEMLTASIAQSEQQLKQLQWNGGYSAANLIGQVVKDLPKQLQLKTIEMKALQPENSPTNLLNLTGSTSDLQAMNNWIFLLKQHAWAKEVKLINYGLPSDESDYQFNLSISY